MAVEVTSTGLKVGDRDIPLVLGAVHYWRLDHHLWDELLEKVQDMGFNMIETYVPWSVHELSPGRFDFGDQDPRKNLGAFLDLCAKRNIFTLIRPGPHINSELTCFGYPERVLADPVCQSVSAQGTPVILPVPPKSFPVPSYASRRFFDEVATWFDAVCPIIESRIHPKGCVIAVQADNEMSLFFRTSAYDHDYSEGAVRLFHDFLKQKYGDIATLNKVYKTKYRDFTDLPMLYRFDARDSDDLPRYLDWAAYKEYYILHGLKRITAMLRERGLTGIPVTHNYPGPIQSAPFNVPATEKILDIQGFDMYPQCVQYEALKRGCLTSAAQSRLPFIPEFSSGCWLHSAPVRFEDQRFTTLVTWMHGIKGISFYMLVERERWYGSPIARDGRIRQPNYDYYTKLNEIIGNQKINELIRTNDVLLVSVRGYQYFDSASTLVEPMTPLFTRLSKSSAALECSENPLGFAEPIPIAAEAWFERWYKGLHHAQYPFLMGDTEMDLQALSRYKMLVVPTFEFLSKSEQLKLAEYADRGGLLVMGPRVPELDETMNPCVTLRSRVSDGGEALDGAMFAKVYKVGKGKTVVFESLPVDEDGLNKVISALAGLIGLNRHFPSADPLIETSWHYSPENPAKGVLYVANPTDQTRDASIILDRQCQFRDLWSGETYSGTDKIEFPMESFHLRMMEVS